MIATRQKIQLINRELRRLLLSGRLPGYLNVVTQISRRLGISSWGSPLTRFRKVISRQTVVDAAELTALWEGLKIDLEVAYAEANDQAEEAAGAYDRITSSISGIRSRLSGIMREMEMNTKALSLGSGVLFSDTFTSLSQVDETQTTAAILIDEGVCTLPRDLKKSVAVSTASATLVSEDTKGCVVAGVLLSTLSSQRNPSCTIQVPVGKGTYQAVINLTGEKTGPGISDEMLANAIVIEAAGNFNLTLEISNDSINWTSIHQGFVQRALTASFSRQYVGFLRFTITEGEAVIRRISVIDAGYAIAGSLYSKAFTVSNPTNRVATLRLEMTSSVPVGTNLQTYVATSSSGPWTPIEAGKSIGLADISNRVEIRPTFSVESAGSRIYKGVDSSITSTPPIVDGGELLWGVNGFRVEAFRQNWAQLGDPDHVPSLQDWDSPQTTVRRCVLNSIGSYLLADSWTGPISGSVLCEMSESGPPPYVGILVTSSTSGEVLKQGYNYRFTTWVYSRRDTILRDHPVGCYYPGAAAITDKTACFSLYLNGANLCTRNTSILSGGFGDSDSIDWTFREGWNRVDVLAYIPVTTGDSYGKSAIVFGPNLLQNSRDALYGLGDVVAYGPDVTRVSEFQLRWEVPVKSTNYWAFAQDGAGNVRYILTNFDPGATANPAIDTSITGSVPITALRYKHMSTNNQETYFRADLAVGASASSPPVIYDYALYEVS